MVSGSRPRWVVRLGRGGSDRVGSERGGACCIPQALAPAVQTVRRSLPVATGGGGRKVLPGSMVGPAAGEVNP